MTFFICSLNRPFGMKICTYFDYYWFCTPVVVVSSWSHLLQCQNMSVDQLLGLWLNILLNFPINSRESISPADFVKTVVENSSFEHQLFGVDARGRIVAMRHGRRVPKLNRPPDQRKALLRGLTTQLLKHGRIKTTKPRAKAMRKYVEKMITLAKDGSLHKRRQALAFIYEKHIVHALFAEVADRYGDREGGYTRIIPTFPRRGDNAPMAYIELV